MKKILNETLKTVKKAFNWYVNQYSKLYMMPII